VITTNCLRRSWRSRCRRVDLASPPDLVALLDHLEDPTSDLSRHWDWEHDQHVLARLLELIEPEFEPTTWQAFRTQVIDGVPARAMAAELRMTGPSQTHALP
jgi:hypothetical protein